MMLALLCASLAAVALRAPSPLEPLADAVMDHTPVPLAIALLLRLGSLARPLALCGAIVIALAAGGLLARLYSRVRAASAQPGLALLLTIGVLVALIALVLPSENPLMAGVGVAVYAFELHIMDWQLASSSARRAFLVHNARILGGIAVLITLLYVQPVLFALRTRAAGRPLFAWEPPPPRKPGFDLPGLTPEVTPWGQFYRMDEDMQQPALDLNSWTLSVEGLVRRPLRLRFADLLAMPRHDEWVTQECISNPVGGPLMSTSLFSSVPVAALLALAGPVPAATAVLFAAPDGHEEAIPLARALDRRVLLAYAMDGRLLEQAHGFPVRALVPGVYGFKSIKWVQTVRLTADSREGHWERNGWDPLPDVQTTARIDVARRVGESLLVAGIAFAGRRGVRSVQVRANGGPWHVATLHTPALSALTWVQWRLSLPLDSVLLGGGRRHATLALQARAVDGAGHVQVATRHDQQPAGATGYHTVTVSV